MILLDLKQGSPEWVEARLGIPTASEFHRIITPRTMKPSASADLYLAEKVAEWALRAPLDAYQNEWMERGSKLEEGALFWYECERDCTVAPGGFVLRDDRLVGCSPDGFVGEDGLIEIKCPNAARHVVNLLGNPAEDHRAQIQGQLWITGRRWLDFVSFNPVMPNALARVERDEEFIAALAEAVGAFLRALAKARLRVMELGFEIPEIQGGASHAA